MDNKLIPMTQFVLEHPATHDYEYQLKRHYNYANFLIKPLEPWMFVPVGDDGEVLEEPIYSPINYGTRPEGALRYKNNVEAYNKAKERVLFEGFGYYKTADIWLIRNAFFKLYEHDFEVSTVEDLLKYGSPIAITETAIKQIKG